MWLHIPSACCPSSQESAGSISVSIAQSEALVRSVTWRGKLMQPRYWQRAWQTAHWMRCLSGVTLPPSTVSLGVAAWIASLAASPARTSAPQARAEASLRASGRDYGASTLASLARFDPATCSLRTSQLSLFAGSIPCSLILPASGSMRSGVVFERPMSARPTEESGSSCWPTPAARDWQGTNSEHHQGHDDQLPNFVVRQWQPMMGTAWATPTTRDWKDGACADANVPTNGLLGRQVLRTPQGGAPSSSAGLVLNPRFVEMMMGLPPGWTDCGPAAMASYRSKLHSPCVSSQHAVAGASSEA
jgi:hypothetical protein